MFHLDIQAFKKMIGAVVKEFRTQVVATTLRKARTATRNGWGAICYADGSFYESNILKTSKSLTGSAVATPSRPG